jgi:hypothetical protein
MGKFPKRHNGPNPPKGRAVTQDTLELPELQALLTAFHGPPSPNPNDPDRWVYVVQHVSGSPMAALMVTPTKAGDD